MYKHVIVLLLSLMAILPINSSAIMAEETCTYFVSSSEGDNSADGMTADTAWATIKRLNQQPLSPGDTVCFKSGDTWRFPTDAYLLTRSGNSEKGYITYTAYGEGHKPLFLGSVEKNSTSDWTLTEIPNVWTTADDSFLYAVGNLIFNNEETTGRMENTVNLYNDRNGDGQVDDDESEIYRLDEQGDFYFDPVKKRLLIYSASNPATYYTDIECALRRHIINLGNTSYVKLSNLYIRYGSAHGISGFNLNNIIILNNDISYIGGAIQGGSTRFGNAIEFWKNAHDIVVEGNRIWEIFEAALTTQGDSINVKYNHYFRNNIIWNAGYCFEYFNGPITSSTSNIYFENNTCAYSGYGWGSVPQGRPWSGSHIMSWGNTASISNFYIRNNIFYEAMDRGFKLAGGWTDEALASLFLNNNVWYDSSDVPIVPSTPPWNFMIWYCRSDSLWCGGYSMATFWQYQAETGKDANSIATDPLFIDELNNNYHPILGSPACTISNTGSFVGALPCGFYTVKIDIKPGSDRNNINPNSKGKIKVAILSTEDFDATTVDPLSVVFGPYEAVDVNGTGQIDDADGDGDLDLTLHFYTQEAGIACGEKEAYLTGETFGGLVFEGFDSIHVVGCK